MILRVRLFAILRELVGAESVEVDVPEGATVADVIRALSAVPGLAGVVERLPVAMAVNRTYASADTKLVPQDELALIPPISGGVDIHVRVTEQPLSLDVLICAVGRRGAGAVVSFLGMPRGVERLGYEAYREMAEERMTAILSECMGRYGLQAAAAEHRIGPVPVLEPSIIVAVSAAHRREAFAGAEEVIERIKAEVPIWKSEIDADGTARWIDGAAPPGASSERPCEGAGT